MLIIDDDLNTCKEIKYALQSETTDVYYALSVADGFEQFAQHQFCLVIMDIQLSEINGLSLLEKLRKMNPMPILVLSSKNDTTERIEAFKAGATGYLEKPYELEVCLAHAQSLMQLYADIGPISKRHYTLAFGMDLMIDPELRQATLKGESLNLTRKEFDLLFCLAEHAGQVLSREQLYGYVWSQDIQYNVDEQVKAHIKALRKKMTPAGKEYIKNVWGIGYRFSPDEEEQP
ncbi:response regulator transcription factor [Enterocloster bolteae]|mgnify:CR=1 FL=1|uniref:response regulator transcription factor n=1 Tax=Enterocloster bolteae TaxID=208479 RepID=UPI00210A5525|nr:response regulator transcription factor [uncultured Eisenbergiella sp.]MCQ5144535.1 response regulator transcription factor [Enterocloster bolteae]